MAGADSTGNASNRLYMKDVRPLSLPALFSVAALVLLGMAGGWLILLFGGFHHRLHRYTGDTVFVTGAPALLMAALMFSLAVLGALVLVRARGAGLFAQVLACSAVLLPPALFFLGA